MIGLLQRIKYDILTKWETMEPGGLLSIYFGGALHTNEERGRCQCMLHILI